MVLGHGTTVLPTFMPVATQAALKGLTPQQVEQLGVSLMLNNTYHLNLRPGTEVLRQAGGAHAFQGWRRNLLTVYVPSIFYQPDTAIYGDDINLPVQDSGGFQLVSLSSFTEITEEGALFASPFTGEPTMLTPEESINIQHAIGADIIMQLDDVVSSLTTGPRVEEAMERSVRWLDRCIAFHKASGNDKTQNLFAIIQGGLDEGLRKRCLEEMIKRKDDIPGYAIGGLSGGEEKDIFWRIVHLCTDYLPEDRPRYSMGVGFAEGMLSYLVVCVALGIDMACAADCVFPTRTARFGVALTFKGPLNLRLSHHSSDFGPIDEECPCPTCSSGTSRSLLHVLITHETVAAHAITQHNVVFQARLMGRIRDAILEDRFPAFAKAFFKDYFGSSGYPRWCVDALWSVGVDLLDKDIETLSEEIKVLEGDGAKWEYSKS
ncbi:Queuine tRNA-ribosyltransferase; AltName: Full=Guanine insertion enzyme; AltName: Full=tRNA-guanine transglycosylase [Serendipita indica DSM 11827]|nr:Queuine tRNA-ribosyltransferase; AltName: Full=Guanine insertion enzyme; AltName: Full=tRNA-guanine transglycosylase [Serendipita indica DSM 11827]